MPASEVAEAKRFHYRLKSIATIEMLANDSDVEMPSSPIRSESSDVRARAPTVNPLLQTTNDRGEHKVGRDDIESSDAEEQQQNGPALEETLDDEKHLISSVLLFSGVAPPPSWRSPWMLCRVFWPLVVAFGVIVQIGYVTFELKTKLFDNLKVAYTLEIPTTLAFASSLQCYTWLWQKAKELLSETRQQGTVLLSAHLRTIYWSSAYIAFWL